jgi:hypothetical protein
MERRGTPSRATRHWNTHTYVLVSLVRETPVSRQDIKSVCLSHLAEKALELALLLRRLQYCDEWPGKHVVT